MKINEFQKIIWNYYSTNKRDFSWRHTRDSYNILVSEVMLQQTQVSRVLLKYAQFIEEFPNFVKLSKASLKQVLSVWQGLGYNRRALYLQATAKIVMETYNGKLPTDVKTLTTLPGIGVGTAGAVRSFAFNKPEVFIETNIRRVFIHFFFSKKKNIHDKDILILVEKTLDRKNPREWYYALMDYGAMLGKIVQNPNRRSKTYIKQTKFEGSDRQIRGYILRNLLKESMDEKEILHKSQFNSTRVKKILLCLKKEGFIYYKNKIYHVT